MSNIPDMLVVHHFGLKEWEWKSHDKSVMKIHIIIKGLVMAYRWIIERSDTSKRCPQRCQPLEFQGPCIGVSLFLCDCHYFVVFPKVKGICLFSYTSCRLFWGLMIDKLFDCFCTFFHFSLIRVAGAGGIMVKVFHCTNRIYGTF